MAQIQFLDNYLKQQKMPFFPKYNLLFLHIPKTGGTSVENTLQEVQGEDHFDWAKSIEKSKRNDNQWQEVNLYGSKIVEGKEFATQHATFHQIKSWKYFENEQPAILITVRNPYSRMVSEYRWQLLFGYEGSFESFVRDTYNKRWYVQPNILHQHLLPQSEFIKGVDLNKENVFVVYFEHFQEAMQHFFQVMSENHKEFETAVLRRDNETNKISIGSAHAKESTKSWRSYYTSNQLVRLVQQMYAQDFALFGYSLAIDQE